LAAGLLFACLPAARAQAIDVFAGLNTLTAKQVTQIPKLSGGVFPSAGAELWIGAIGIGAEAAFRATTTSQNLRPTYYDVNLLLSPFHITRSAWPELMVGVGSQDVQGFEGLGSCGSLTNCSQYAGNHLAGHLGLALKIYATEHFFIRPEAHFYFVHGNQAFPNAQRFGVSLGYTFGGSTP